MAPDLNIISTLIDAQTANTLVIPLPQTIYGLRQHIIGNKLYLAANPGDQELAELVVRQECHLAECEAALKVYCFRLRGEVNIQRCPVCHNQSRTVGDVVDVHGDYRICSGSGRRIVPRKHRRLGGA